MKIIKHFVTITKHRWEVRKICFKIGIFYQGLTHDLSKYSPVEFFNGAKYYLGTKSPTIAEREDKGYSAAWMHHRGRNKHHFEYWVDLNPQTKMYEPVPMPMNYLKEMFCDRVAASKIYQGKNYKNSHPLEYFKRGNARKKMHEATADVLEQWLTILAEQGEREAFRHIKKIKNNYKYY